MGEKGESRPVSAGGRWVERPGERPRERRLLSVGARMAVGREIIIIKAIKQHKHKHAFALDSFCSFHCCMLHSPQAATHDISQR